MYCYKDSKSKIREKLEMIFETMTTKIRNLTTKIRNSNKRIVGVVIVCDNYV